MNIECKDCGAQITVTQDSMVGEIITCPDCGADFEITLKNGRINRNQASRISRRRLGTIDGAGMCNLR